MKKVASEVHENGQASDSRALPSRRRVLEMVGMSALALPVLGLAGCSGGDETAGSAASGADAAKPASKPPAAMPSTVESAVESTAESPAESPVETAVEKVETAMESSAEAMDDPATIATDSMPRVDENGPQAKGLGYVHDATTSGNARYASGQQCANCALYLGGGSAWGGCPLFAGKQVKATGWCSAYAAAA